MMRRRLGDWESAAPQLRPHAAPASLRAPSAVASQPAVGLTVVGLTVVGLAMAVLGAAGCQPASPGAGTVAGAGTAQSACTCVGSVEGYSRAELDAKLATLLAATASRAAGSGVSAEVEIAKLKEELQALTSWRKHTAVEQAKLEQQLAELKSMVARASQPSGYDQEAFQKLQKTVQNLASAPPPAPVVVTQVPPPPFHAVAVGDLWVDRYENSLWVRLDGAPVDCATLQNAVDAAKKAGASEAQIYFGGDGGFCQTSKAAAICQFRQLGTPPGCSDDKDCDDYPSGFPDSGSVSEPVYACPILGVVPSANMTWFQAVMSCAASGKHLLSNAEWQTAALGTWDPGSHDGKEGLCNTKGGKTRPTGQSDQCISVWNVEDMVGNLDEWVSDWMIGGQAPMTGKDFSSTPFTTYGDGNDYALNVNGTAFSNAVWNWVAGLPSTPFRGGHHSSGTGAGVYSISLRGGVSDWGKIHGVRCGVHVTAGQLAAAK